MISVLSSCPGPFAGSKQMCRGIGHFRHYPRFSIAAASLAAALCLSSGCTTGKVLVTPLTVVRDTVDFPLVTVTNFFAWIARSSGPPGAFAGPSWSWRGGFDFGIGLNLASWVFWTLSGAVGAVDYVVCRSFYPNFPYGVSPWTKRGQSLWSLYYCNTRALWKKKPAEAPPPPPPPPSQPGPPPTTVRHGKIVSS